jgi:hypothetical protein
VVSAMVTGPAKVNADVIYVLASVVPGLRPAAVRASKQRCSRVRKSLGLTFADDATWCGFERRIRVSRVMAQGQASGARVEFKQDLEANSAN